MSAITELQKSRGEVLFGMPRAEYDASPRLHHSTLVEMGVSPAHYVHAVANPREATAAMKLGNVTHIAILEPERFASSCVVFHEDKVGKPKEWKAFKEANADRTILTEEERRAALAMQTAVRRHPVAARYLENGDAEVSLFWDFEAPPAGALPGFRFEMKGRLDWLARAGAIVDLKTTADASPEGFAKQCVNLGTFEQAALYSDGYFSITGIRLPYIIIAVENFAPHVCTVFSVGQECLEYGRERYFTNLSRLDACRATGQWGGYADGEVSLSLPYWLKKQMEQNQ